MEKKIRISEKDYQMKASALTQFSYKNETGRSFLTDLQKLTELKGLGEDLVSNIDAIDNVIDLILYIHFFLW